MKNRRYTTILSGVLVMAVLFIIGLLRSGGEYVVLVSADAFRWDYPDLYETPALDLVATEGVRAKSLVPAFPTKTFPNHYTIATGLYPDHHGLVNNSFHDPELDLVYTMGDRQMVEDARFYGGEPVWNTVRKNGMMAASMFWVGSEAPVNGMQPDYWNRYTDSISFEARVDSVITWLSLPRKKRPRFVTLYFEEPDGVAHDYGPVSHETDSVVRVVDSNIGRLYSRLKALPISGKINLIILSDHGMGEISNDRLVNLGTLLPGELVAEYRGGNPVYLVEPARGSLDSLLAIISATEGIRGYTGESMPHHYQYGSSDRIPDLVIEADSGWSVVWTSRRNYAMRGKGTHGYDPMNSDMQGIFYATGPSFREGIRTGSYESVDVYNLICNIFGIDPAPNDGGQGLADATLKRNKNKNR